MKIIPLITLIVALAASQTVNYCDSALCKKNAAGGGYYIAKHIACRNNGDFVPACPRERSIIPMTKELMHLLVNLHNEYRSRVATGKLAGFLKANQMIEMSWSSELAKLAELNVKTCRMAHDACRSTDQYSKPGQNLGITKTTAKEYPDAIKTVYNHTSEWFIEYRDCDMSYIRSYRSSYEMIGHFTQIIVAGADRIGCAISKFNNGRRNILLACNYSLGNLISRPIYETGEPCSKCKSGCSNIYPGLCKTNEKSYWSADEIQLMAG